MARGIKETDVWNACDALLLEGARPTIERVRQKIGSGSPNTVSPFLDTWFRHLGGRIKDPGAFSVPPGLPDPVIQAAAHFWEVANTNARLDFEERLRDGLAFAVANVEAEKDKAAQAGAAAFEAASRFARLQGELEDQARLLDGSRQELAAERGRLEELRMRQAEAALRGAADHSKWSGELHELRQQLSAAVGRADAADRRVAMELERERGARAKAERHAETLHKSLETTRETSAIAIQDAQRHLNVARDREEALRVQLAGMVAELAIEKQRLTLQRSVAEASAANTTSARAEVASLQRSVERLATLVEAAGQPKRVSARKRSGRAT